jgi:hypothetical protein
MEITSTPFFAVPMVFGVVGLVYLFIASCKPKWPRPSRVAIIVFVVPSLLCLAMFYALAVHMHWSLSGWPESIGDKGLSGSLILHADLVRVLFGALLTGTLFVWPVLFLLSILFGWRPFSSHLGAHAIAFAVCFVLMLLAPEPFLYWWWD